MIEFPLNIRDTKEDWAWFKGSLWLSLDRFERFWPDVGLSLSNGEAAKSTVRAALRAKYAIDAANREKWAIDPDAEEDLNYIDPLVELSKTFLGSIAETSGMQDAECIAGWLAGPVRAAIKEPPWHKAWSMLLYGMGKEDPSTLVSLYGIPSDTARRVVEIATRYRSEDDANHERVEAADLEPLSGWDAIAYADYRWETPEPSPFDGLWLHLRYICFDRAWAEVVRCTRPADIDALILWGRAQIGPNSALYEQEAIIPEEVRSASRAT